MKSTYLPFFFLALAIPAFSQWTSQTDVNTLVASSETGDVQSVGTSDGKTFVAFWKNVPDPFNYEMRLQLLDAQGHQLFGPEGMLVNNVVPMSTFTTLWSVAIDRDNNVFIGFNGSGAGNLAYVHKISPEGEQLWGPNGISPGAGFDVKVLPLSNGEVIVAWLPGNQGVFQRFDASGNALWANPVTIQPLVANHRTSAGEMAELPGGDVMILIHDRGGFSPSSFFHAQRYDASGAPVWAAPSVLANASTSFNRRYSIFQEGEAVYLGYSAALGLVFHSYLQKINADGTLPWGINGSDFSTGTIYYERDTEIASLEGSPFIWAVCEYTSTSQGQIGEYVQKFDKQTGARLFSDNAKELFAVDDNHISHRGSLQLIEDRPVFMLSKGYNNGATPVELIVTFLDAQGDFIWPEYFKTLGNYPSSKLRFDFLRPFNGQCVGVWTETRPEINGSRAFAQNISVLDCAFPTAGFSVSAIETTASFISTATLADFITWDFGDNTLGTGTAISHTYSAEGVYNVCQYASNGCGTDTVCASIVVMITSSTEPNQSAAFEVYPNPSNGDFFVKSNTPAPYTFSFEIINAAGQSVHREKTRFYQTDEVVGIQKNGLPDGVYYLNMIINGQTANLRFVVKN